MPLVKGTGLEGLAELLKLSDDLADREEDEGGFEEHIGQEKFKKLAEIHVEGGGRFPHTILTGNPGLGKTHLAKMLARRLGGRFRYFLGADLDPTSAHQLVEETQPGDIVFIDEIHSIHRKGAELLYDVVQDGLYRNQPVASFTMIGATTDVGKVPKPLRDRCWIHPVEYYSTDELLRIIKAHYPGLSREDAMECATRAHGVPRLALRRLAMHVDAARGRMTCHEVFLHLGVDAEGFLPEHRQIVKVLYQHAKPMGLEELAFRVDVPKDDLVMYEALLLRLGYVSRTHRGRVVTPSGIAYLGRVEEGKNENASSTQPQQRGQAEC